MSVWKVYSKDGGIERCELHAVEYGGTYMGERAVTATFTSSCEVEFGIFDYIVYRGEKFEIEAIPTVKKISSFEYVYELRFVSLKYELERCEMRDLVPYDNDVVYPTPLTFSFTGNVRYLTERIQACLDSLYGDGVWNIVLGDGVESEEKNVTIAQQNCWNALALVNSTYGLDFHIKGRTITIGETISLVDHVFEYGKGNGLYEIERASDTDTGIVTKLRAFGGTRNLDYSYPKRPEWVDSVLPVSFAFSPLRLMLPSFKYDGKTDYVLADEETIAKYGIRESSIIYEDIYPSIIGATHNGQAIDEIKSVEAVDDNSGTFVVYLHDLGFDLEEHLTTSDAQISMKTGAMQGYTFTMTSIEKKEDGSNKITLNRVSAEGGENYNIPNSDWNMKAGDKFVLLNILMPQKYIRDAEERLEARAKEYLGQYAKTNFSYNIGLHDKFLVQNPSVYDSLIEGAKLSVYDGELGINEEVTIQSITITENTEDNILPQVKVTLNNQPSASTLDRIQGKIDSLANETAAGNFATQSEIMSQYRKKLDKPFFDKLFVAVGLDGKEIASTDVTTPVAYIKAKYNFAAVGGITSFAMGEEVDVPQIYDGLPIDNKTLYWVTDENGKKVMLKAKGGGSGEGGGIEYALSWSGFSSGSWNGSETKDIYIPSKVSELSNDSAFITSSALNNYATKDFVTGKGYITASALNGYATESWVKNQGYALASALGNYLPLTGGTITGNLTVNDTVYCDVYRSKNGRWLFGGGETAISFGGYYAGVPTTFNGETLKFYACSEEQVVVDNNGVTFRERIWCVKSAVALYFQSLTACETSANTTGHFRMGRFDESDGGFKMQFGGTGTTGTLQVVDQQWTKSLFKLDKSGNLLVSGGITMYSDERKKTILNHVQLSLREVAGAPLIEHYYNSDTEKTTHVGSIAQYWAGLNDWFCKVDADGFYTMEVQNAALASAISVARELLKYETKTDKQIRKLKKRISELEEEVELLKKM